MFKELLGSLLLCLLLNSNGCSCNAPVVSTNPSVTIHYRQSANFLGGFWFPVGQDCSPQAFQNQTVSFFNGPGKGGMWVFYEITGIDNTGANAVPFTFSPTSLYVLYSGTKYHQASTPLAGDGCLQPIENVNAILGPGQLVTPGQSTSYLGRFVINFDDVNEADGSALFPLLYDAPAGLGITMKREDGYRPAYMTNKGPGLPVFFSPGGGGETRDVLQCTNTLTPPAPPNVPGCVPE